VHVAECLEGSSQGLSSKGAVVTVRNERGVKCPHTKRKSADTTYYDTSTTKHASLASAGEARQRKILKKCGGTGEARVEVSSESHTFLTLRCGGVTQTLERLLAPPTLSSLHAAKSLLRKDQTAFRGEKQGGASVYRRGATVEQIRGFASLPQTEKERKPNGRGVSFVHARRRGEGFRRFAQRQEGEQPLRRPDWTDGQRDWQEARPIPRPGHVHASRVSDRGGGRGFRQAHPPQRLQHPAREAQRVEPGIRQRSEKHRHGQ
jgi:ribosomal protein L31